MNPIAVQAALSTSEWDALIDHLHWGRCTPFLGGETANPPRSKIAAEWSSTYRYPLADTQDLAHVAQYIVTKEQRWKAADLMTQSLRQAPEVGPPEFPHLALAKLPIPVYVTTTYDDLMYRAVETLRNQAPFKAPRRDLCRWRNFYGAEASVLQAGFQPSEAEPLIFHLHGHVSARMSLAVTEDDYLDFLISTSAQPNLIPPRIQEAFGSSAFLFLGYRVEDLEFRVLLRSLAGYMKSNETLPRVYTQVIQVAKDVDQAQAQALQEFVSSYCKNPALKLTIEPRTPADFMADLYARYRQKYP